MPADRVSLSSMTARQSAAKVSSVYAAAPSGRSERPLPRPSIVSTRQCLAKYGTWHFQNRECLPGFHVIAHIHINLANVSSHLGMHIDLLIRVKCAR